MVWRQLCVCCRKCWLSWSHSCLQYLAPDMSAMLWSNSGLLRVLLKKMVSLHCLTNIENYTYEVYVCICGDTPAFFILIKNFSITHHKKVNKKEFHMYVHWWCGFLSCCLLDSQHLLLLLAALCLWVHLFPIMGWTLICCLIGCVCFWLSSKLLRASPTETPGMSVQTGLSSTILSNSSVVESQKKHICVWEQEEVSESWTFSSLKGLVNCCLVMILGLWLVTYTHANTFFTTGFNKFVEVQQYSSLRHVDYLFLSC